MKKRIVSLLITAMVLAMNVILVGCSDEYYDDAYYSEGGSYEDGYYDENNSYGDGDYSDEGNYQQTSWAGSYSGGAYPLGSAGELEGTTIVVSMFLDDAASSWSGADAVKFNTLKYLGIASDYIVNSAAEYGVNSNFIYDWQTNEDLYFEGSISADVAAESDDLDYQAWQCVEYTVDSESLKSKYGADNIVYMLFLNVPESNSVTSFTRNWYEGMEYPYEMCYILCALEGEEENPSAYAHEMLHTFGAPDLYRVDDDGSNYGITQEFVDELNNSNNNDIMYTNYNCQTGRAEFDCISNEFTEIDAYYVGLTDSSSVVDEWGFEKSQHSR